MSHITYASKTLAKIEEVMEADQGNSFRKYSGLVLPHIGDAYQENDMPFRTHMGASLIGGDCGRAIWYGFHWTTAPKFGGRQLRLFNRGHLEEGRFVALLLMIGCQVYQQDENGNQFRISDAGGHFGGSGDGVVVNLPDLEPGQPALCEMKTHNDKSFKKLTAEGVRSSKFEHFVQMQVYMRKMGLAVALYVAVNKNDDALHMELVYLEPSIADEYINRGVTLVFMDHPPRKINESSSWWKCKWCDHRPVCHLNKAPERNCRTCKSSKVNKDGTWGCNFDYNNRILSKDEQYAGCENYKRAF
ncbi:exonuclease [Alteromonas phage vB_AcoS-R7M]|uniref:Exonuclease n=1 Tax=Alteromonas phage vB_AcoS-R7M TaxID=2729541 RepID=A0A6M3YNF7_9CAUD|nr:Cas4-domain exonuclease [Alteromonas phage vB_AcoS-R7M]QJI53377.1 exonuclease [Alteromonas phage vB_AcoS-R7M]